MLAGTLTVEKAETTSRWYFYGGFCLLPWLWIANVLMFWKHRDASPKVGFYVRASLISGIAGFCALIIYIAVAHAVMDPLSPLWIIRPRQPPGTLQGGLFSAGVYNNLQG